MHFRGKGVSFFRFLWRVKCILGGEMRFRGMKIINFMIEMRFRGKGASLLGRKCALGERSRLFFKEM